MKIKQVVFNHEQGIVIIITDKDTFAFRLDSGQNHNLAYWLIEVLMNPHGLVDDESRLILDNLTTE